LNIKVGVFSLSTLKVIYHKIIKSKNMKMIGGVVIMSVKVHLIYNI